MKRNAIFLTCFLAGLGIGWYFGYACPAAKRQREWLEKYQPLKNELETNMAYLNRQREEEDKLAEPWEAGSATVALAALKDLDKNNLEDAKLRLSTLITFYYNHHDSYRDTNLLNDINIYITTNSTLSNTIHKAWQGD